MRRRTVRLREDDEAAQGESTWGERILARPVSRPPVARIAPRGTGPARRVRPEVFDMRPMRLAGGRISEWGSGPASHSCRALSPNLAEPNGAPRLPVPPPRPCDRSRPSRGDEGKIPDVENTLISGGAEELKAAGMLGILLHPKCQCGTRSRCPLLRRGPRGGTMRSMVEGAGLDSAQWCAAQHCACGRPLHYPSGGPRPPYASLRERTPIADFR